MRVQARSAANRHEKRHAPPARLAIEAGTHSPWVSSLLEEAGHEVLVANPRKLRLIYSGDNKHDRLDAEQLARVARMDPRLLSPIEHRARQSRADLALLRARDLLVRSRTQMVCHVRGALKSFGTRLPKCSTRTLPSRGLLGIPEDLRPALVHDRTPMLRGSRASDQETTRHQTAQSG